MYAGAYCVLKIVHKFTDLFVRQVTLLYHRSYFLENLTAPSAERAHHHRNGDDLRCCGHEAFAPRSPRETNMFILSNNRSISDPACMGCSGFTLTTHAEPRHVSVANTLDSSGLRHTRCTLPTRGVYSLNSAGIGWRSKHQEQL